MRHRVDHRKLNRTSSHRRAMLRNLVTSLFDKERVTTTSAKAKEARRYAERLITRAKKGYAAYQAEQALRSEGREEEARQKAAEALTHWRQAARFVMKKNVMRKLFEDLAPIYMERNGGYTRILKLGNRPGDNASMVMLELVGTEITSKPRVKKPRKPKAEEAEEVPAAPGGAETGEGSPEEEKEAGRPGQGKGGAGKAGAEGSPAKGAPAAGKGAPEGEATGEEGSSSGKEQEKG